MSSATMVSVSNSNTTYLPQQVHLSFNHLQSSDVDPTCVYWPDENGPGVWSGRGCTLVISNSTHTNVLLQPSQHIRSAEGNPSGTGKRAAVVDDVALLKDQGARVTRCANGFTQPNSNPEFMNCIDIDECVENQHFCGERGICVNQLGSYLCKCPTGFINYGNRQTQCAELNCDQYETQPGQTLPGFDSFLSMLKKKCLVLNSSTLPGPTRLLPTGDVLLTLLVNTTDVVQLGLQSNGHRSSSEVTKLLRTIEISFRLIAPLLTENVTRIETNHTEVEIMVRRDKTPPKGPVSLTNENTQLDTTWETVVGDYQNYLGFAYVVLLSYRNLDSLKDNTSHQSQQLMSSAATVSVSNSNTTYLPQQVNLTFHHLQSSDVDPTCVYWSDENGPGVWSGRGCTLVISNSTHTVCSCNHLSTFALLKGIHHGQGSGQLSLVMWVGVFVALTCVFLSLITTLWCRFVSRKRRGGHRLQQDVQLHRK
ncbi:CD97 antigen-like [Oncorhynchus kisutch]|uniref:CD97 antigen-like n=1 Tax=Oncorhynchus kisutch TaxID=8019 RepID=UPI0012DDAFEA|nr:CD97 antigen-like [Oncorhynchus kisutch]